MHVLTMTPRRPSELHLSLQLPSQLSTRDKDLIESEGLAILPECLHETLLSTSEDIFIRHLLMIHDI